MDQTLNAVLVFDADNTLWDTNAVFRHAQLSLLHVFAEAGFFNDEESQLETLRIIDRELIHQLGRFEYDFHILTTAIAYHYSKGITAKDAVHEAITDANSGSSSESSPIIIEAYRRFEEELKQIPALFPDTEAVLSSIHSCRSDQNPVAILIFSDGNPSRLERILQAHGIRDRCLFDDIIIGTKSVEAFYDAKQVGMKYLEGNKNSEKALFVMIGDSLQRDIKLGNRAGYITVYKPANFLGLETPREKDEQPCYTISTLSDLLPILRDIGIPVFCSTTSHQQLL